MAALKSDDLLEPRNANILFFTVVHERRSDLDRFAFSIDCCFIDAEQADERVELLQSCNIRGNDLDVLQRGRNKEHGCCWASLTEVETDKVRYFVEVQPLWMLGNIRTVDKRDEATEIRSARLLSTVDFDLAGHVFVIAVHDPDGIPFAAPDSTLSKMPWTIKSVHSSCDQALTRARQVWKDAFYARYGSPQQSIGHYGMCRYTFSPRLNDAPHDLQHRVLHYTGTQVRVERIKVTLPEGGLNVSLSAKASLHKKPWQSFYPDHDITFADRYMQELSGPHTPAGVLPWETDTSHLQLLDKPDNESHADSVIRPALPFPRRGLNDTLAHYTDAVAEILARPVTPSTMRSVQQMKDSIHESNGRSGRLSSLRQSVSSYISSSTSRKLQRRSNYAGEHVVDPVDEIEMTDFSVAADGAKSKASQEVKARHSVEAKPVNKSNTDSEPAVVEMKPSMLTGTFRWM